MKNTKHMIFRYNRWLAMVLCLCLCLIATMKPIRIVQATELDGQNEEIGQEQPEDESVTEPDATGEEDGQTSDTDETEGFGENDGAGDDANVVLPLEEDGDDEANVVLPMEDEEDESKDEGLTGIYEGIAEIELPQEAAMPDDVISMALPIMSNATYDFTLDPQELLKLRTDLQVLAEGGTVYFHHAGDQTVFSPFSDVATAVNRSTVPVQLSVELQINNGTEAGVVYTNINEVSSGEEPKLAFAIVPTTTGTVIGGETPNPGTMVKNKLVSTDANGHASLVFYLPSMEQNFEIVEIPESDGVLRQYRYVSIENAEWPTVGFSVAGACNRNADWVALAESLEAGQRLSLRVLYRMDVMDKEKEARIESGEISWDQEAGTISE